MKMYAIKQCDTVKKAQKWLDSQGIAYEFHDYKKLGAPEDKLQQFCTEFGWQRVVNMKGMTWRKLDDAEKEAINSQAKAIELMREKSSIIKRPILEYPGGILLGFDESEWSQALKRKAA